MTVNCAMRPIAPLPSCIARSLVSVIAYLFVAGLDGSVVQQLKSVSDGVDTGHCLPSAGIGVPVPAVAVNTSPAKCAVL